jgi:hypothetical protein
LFISERAHIILPYHRYIDRNHRSWDWTFLRRQDQSCWPPLRRRRRSAWR